MPVQSEPAGPLERLAALQTVATDTLRRAVERRDATATLNAIGRVQKLLELEMRARGMLQPDAVAVANVNIGAPVESPRAALMAKIEQIVQRRSQRAIAEHPEQ